ncbi:glycosyltransferase family 4 protein [Gramella sp. AN32]|uniref:Glycosyltransferase family 4 protein n=1 Tax=Christiangramia antarctica TaxID=2058158 RepID=A0ABW5X6T8_9FLAO|nr:glycosyltransferase family 4 protein [Gramella sp. AN32]MCM4154678.1 glycosyl transferase family 1 [Gramella sp. AN32]
MKKRILYIGNDLQVNSFTATYISFFSKMLRKEGYTVRTASTRNNKALRLVEMLALLARYKKTTDIVLIDTYGAMNFYYAYLVGKTCELLKMDYIPILHGGNLPERLEDSKNFSKDLFGNSLVNVAPSKYLFNVFQKHNFKNTQIIPNSIRLKNYPFKERNDFQPKLLWVRRFQKRYNPILAVEVLKIINEKIPGATMCMVGPDKDGSLHNCKKLGKKYGLEITFTGKLKKKQWAKLSRDYDFFINTTSIDNTPISVIEAMSLGLPIISTRVGGMDYLIDNNVDGILVLENDAQAMATEVLRLIENPETALELSRKARAKVEGFDWEIVKEKWNRLLET